MDSVRQSPMGEMSKVPLRRRKPRAGDPLVRPKGPKAKVVPRTSTPVSGGPPPPPDRRPDNGTSGFSSPSMAPFQDFPLILDRKPIHEGFRHHVARFQNRDQTLDLRNPEEFVRPVRLQRRDPRRGPKGEEGAEDEDPEAQKWAALKAERDALRDAEMAQVAPGTVSGGNRKLGPHIRKTEQVYRNDLTEEQRARSKLRYEEALPWHLDDFEGKNCWAGTYEAALSETYAMMVQDEQGAFRIMPLEKWYKFTQKNQFKTLSIEEAESRFNKRVKEPRWFMDSEQVKREQHHEAENKKARHGLFIGKWERQNGVVAPVTKTENADADDLDFQEDRFADDEENMLFEEDEETKEAEERIKRDQLQANIFDLKEEKEYEKQEQLEQREKDAEKKLGKRVKKALLKREKNFIYDSDSPNNPYTEESSSASEAEPAKPEEAKPGSRIASGSNTPSHRLSKQPLSRTASANDLKRPGSPYGSDMSGNESSRKKAKKQIKAQPGLVSSASQPVLSLPRNGPKRTWAGSGSDSEGGVVSAAETSDGLRKKMKITLRVGSRDASPNDSRATSPDARLTKGPSRVASPGVGVPTASEIRSRIPSTGISLNALLNNFRGRLVGTDNNQAFMRLMKENARFDKTTKLLYPIS